MAPSRAAETAPIPAGPRGHALILAAIAQRFRLALMPDQRVTPTPYITIRPEPGIRMRFERR